MTEVGGMEGSHFSYWKQWAESKYNIRLLFKLQNSGRVRVEWKYFVKGSHEKYRRNELVLENRELWKRGKIFQFSVQTMENHWKVLKVKVRYSDFSFTFMDLNHNWKERGAVGGFWKTIDKIKWGSVRGWSCNWIKRRQRVWNQMLRKES